MRALSIAAFLVACGSSPPAPPSPPPGNEAPAGSPPPPVELVGVVMVDARGSELVAATGVVFEGDTVAGAEVDLVDCGGWLGRVRLVAEDGDPIGWRAEVLATAPLSPAAPCRTPHGWEAFAVLPAHEARTGAVAADLATWTGAGTPAMWADLDGDASIDLVEIEGPCKPHDDYVCGTISVRVGDTWRPVGRTTPL